MSVVVLDDENEEGVGGAPSRHIDLETAMLDRYARSWIDLQQTRKALDQREMPAEIVAEFDKLEKRVSLLLSRALRKHPLWGWLSQFPGLGGAHTALVIGRIGDPRRYPGQRCSEGHYLPPVYAVGEMCPVAVTASVSGGELGDEDDVAGVDDHGVENVAERSVCPGYMLDPRPGTGTRSLWHWAGLHVEADGRAPRKRKGSRVTYEPRVRASVMQPGGIAEQIVRLSVPHYVEVYRTTKERLSLRVEEVGEGDPDSGPQSLSIADITSAIERPTGDADLGAAGGDLANVPVHGRPLRPFEADRIARKVAAKAFLGDLLSEWKAIEMEREVAA